jgi:hypothetical protein
MAAPTQMVRLNKPTHIRALFAVRSRSLLVILGTLLLVVPGHGQSAGDEEDPTAQLSKLQSVLFAYADKYMSGIAQITSEVRQRDPANPELRLRMHSLRLVVTASVQGLAVSANPEATLDYRVAGRESFLPAGGRARDQAGPRANSGHDPEPESFCRFHGKVTTADNRRATSDHRADGERYCHRTQCDHSRDD